MKTTNLIVCLAFVLFSGCNTADSAKLNNQYSATPQPTIPNIQPEQNVNSNSNQINAIVEDSISENEITECSPEKIYRGETFKVSFKESHGKNFAIYNEKTREFYFLTENAPYYFPQISPDEFYKLTSFEFNTSEVRSMSKEIGKDDYNKSKPYFDRTGWYAVIIGHLALDVDFIDMPITGSCRVYYVNKKRPSGK